MAHTPITLIIVAATLAVNFHPAALRAADEKPDGEAARSYVENALALLKLGESLKIPKAYRSGPMADRDPYAGARSQAMAYMRALEGDIPGALRAIEELGNPSSRSYAQAAQIVFRYHGIKPATQLVHNIRAAAGGNPLPTQLNALYALYYRAQQAKNQEAMKQVITHSMGLCLQAEVAARQQPKQEFRSRETTLSHVIMQFVRIQIEAGDFSGAREMAAMELDAKEKEWIDKLINEWEEASKTTPTAKNRSAVAHEQLLEAARQELSKRDETLAKLVRLGDVAKIIEHVNTIRKAESRVRPLVLCAAILINDGNSKDGATCARLMLENAAFLIAPTDVSKPALELLLLVEPKADVELISRIYATAGRLSGIVPQNAGHVDMAAGALAGRQTRNGNLQGAVDWLYNAPRPHLTEVVFIRLAVQLLDDVANGLAAAKMPSLKPPDKRLMTLADDHTFQGKSLEYWVNEFGSPDLKDGNSPPAQRDAATALAGIGRPALPALIELHKKYCKTNERPGSRYVGAAGHAMWRIGADAVPSLVELFATQSDLEVVDTAEILRVIGRPSVLPLCSLLKHKDPKMRLRTCMALRGLSRHADQALDALTEAKSDPDKNVQKQAANVIEAIMGRPHY